MGTNPYIIECATQVAHEVTIVGKDLSGVLTLCEVEVFFRNIFRKCEYLNDLVKLFQYTKHLMRHAVCILECHIHMPLHLDEDPWHIKNIGI